MFAEDIDYTEYDLYQLDEDGLGFAWSTLISPAVSLVSSGMQLYGQKEATRASAKQQAQEYKYQSKLIAQQAGVVAEAEQSAFQRAMILAQTTIKKVPTWVYVAGGGALVLVLVLTLPKRRRG